MWRWRTDIPGGAKPTYLDKATIRDYARDAELVDQFRKRLEPDLPTSNELGSFSVRRCSRKSCGSGPRRSNTLGSTRMSQVAARPAASGITTATQVSCNSFASASTM
jgi:hypothetical protein